MPRIAPHERHHATILSSRSPYRPEGCPRGRIELGGHGSNGEHAGRPSWSREARRRVTHRPGRTTATCDSPTIRYLQSYHIDWAHAWEFFRNSCFDLPC